MCWHVKPVREVGKPSTPITRSMANFTTPTGRIAFCSLNEPRENLSKNLEWNVAIQLTEEESVPLQEALIKEIEVKQKAGKFPAELPSNMNWPYRPGKEKNEAGDLVEVPGTYLWKFVRKATRMIKGEVSRNAPPQIFDASGTHLMTPPQIGGGSLVRAIFEPFAYSKIQFGVQCQLRGVQIVSLVDANEIKLDAVEGGWIAPDNALGQLQHAPSDNPLADVFGGEVADLT